MKTYNISTNSSTAVFYPPNYDDYGASYELCASGTWGAGTLQAMQSPDNVNWYNIGSPLTANGRAILQVFSGNALRLTLSGASAASLIAFISGPGV